MKIYKFKDLSDTSLHNHLFQIIDENKVWCASPDTLNDQAEFSFEMDYIPTEKTAILLMRMIEKLGTSNIPSSMSASYAIINNKLEEFSKPHISDIVEKCRSTIGITSFSLSMSDLGLWKEYGGNGNGVAVEFEISESSIGKTFHLVNYVDRNVFHIDTFFESQIGGSERIFNDILCTKTKVWEHEQEIRFLGKTQNISIIFEPPISSITIGRNVSNILSDTLKSHCETRGINVYFQ